jgi:hypothetical protein
MWDRMLKATRKIVDSKLSHHLNERLVFLVIGNIWFSLLLGVWDIYTGRWNRPKWARDGVSRNRFRAPVASFLRPV